MLETYHRYGIKRITIHHLLCALFVRAACYHTQNEFAFAWADLYRSEKNRRTCGNEYHRRDGEVEELRVDIGNR